MTASTDTYRAVNRETASPRITVLKVFEAAQRELALAEGALAAGTSAAEPLARAHTLVGGLMAALDFSAGDLATKLLGLYVFVSNRILETRTSGKDAGLGAASRVLGTLLEAWREMPREATRPDGLPGGDGSALHLQG